MTEETKNKALRALMNAKCAFSDDEYFPMVFVCGTHVFFTFMAAYRQQQEYRILDGTMHPIERVDTPYNMFVNRNVDQHGDVMPHEIFPSKLYAITMNS